MELIDFLQQTCFKERAQTLFEAHEYLSNIGHYGHEYPIEQAIASGDMEEPHAVVEKIEDILDLNYRYLLSEHGVIMDDTQHVPVSVSHGLLEGIISLAQLEDRKQVYAILAFDRDNHEKLTDLLQLTQADTLRLPEMAVYDCVSQIRNELFDTLERVIDHEQATLQLPNEMEEQIRHRTQALMESALYHGPVKDFIEQTGRVGFEPYPVADLLADQLIKLNNDELGHQLYLLAAASNTKENVYHTAGHLVNRLLGEDYDRISAVNAAIK